MRVGNINYMFTTIQNANEYIEGVRSLLTDREFPCQRVYLSIFNQAAFIKMCSPSLLIKYPSACCELFVRAEILEKEIKHELANRDATGVHRT